MFTREAPCSLSITVIQSNVLIYIQSRGDVLLKLIMKAVFFFLFFFNSLVAFNMTDSYSGVLRYKSRGRNLNLDSMNVEISLRRYQLMSLA